MTGDRCINNDLIDARIRSSISLENERRSCELRFVVYLQKKYFYHFKTRLSTTKEKENSGNEQSTTLCSYITAGSSSRE